MNNLLIQPQQDLPDLRGRRGMLEAVGKRVFTSNLQPIAQRSSYIGDSRPQARHAGLDPESRLHKID